MGRHPLCLYFTASIYRSFVTAFSSGKLGFTPTAHFVSHHLHRHRKQNVAAASNLLSSTSLTTTRAISDDSSGSMWDPVSQTYVGGAVPSHHTAMDIHDLLALNDGKLKIFGYGSLCWHPGSDGVLSMANIEEDEHDHEHDVEAAAAEAHGDAYVDVASNDSETATSRTKRKVTTAPGRAIGYQRCWSQRSADHRGTTQFNGIVCTLLSDEEVRKLHGDPSHHRSPSMTEGLIYTVDVDLVDDCLAELDFREKGGYARDVIDVVEDDTGKTVKALLYRGTPDNPAFWERALLDLPLAAATMSVAIGPSGPNDVYLFHLNTFLTHASQHSPAAAHALEDHSGDVHTGELANMVQLLQTEYRPYFLFGAGSNEHNQLLLKSNAANGFEGADEVDELIEMLLTVPRQGGNDNDAEKKETSACNAKPKSLYAGGGHSGLLTQCGDLYLWGWNGSGQLGRTSGSSESSHTTAPLNIVQPLSNIKAETADLGHTHTLVIEKGTGRLFGFGEDGRGQVSGCAGDSDHVPQTPMGLSKERFVDVAAGLFHSAAVTEQGELITWGCRRFGQSLCPLEVESQKYDKSSTAGRWRPNDGSKLVKVACGRRHTVVLDEHGRVWTIGDNKYGQLGRSIDHNDNTSNAEPQLVDGPLGQVGSGCFAICSGWSHILALTSHGHPGDVTVYGWGRNDKGQLGMASAQNSVFLPQVLKPLIESKKAIQSACCGAESSHVLDIDGAIYSTGWNEHGNLATGKDEEKGVDFCSSWVATTGVSIVAPPPSKGTKKFFSSGGAHLIVMATR